MQEGAGLVQEVGESRVGLEGKAGRPGSRGWWWWWRLPALGESLREWVFRVPVTDSVGLVLLQREPGRTTRTD